MRKKVLFIAALSVLVLGGCERTEKPTGWDESQVPRAEKGVSIDNKIDEKIKSLISMKPEEIEKIFGKEPSLEEFRDRLFSYLSDDGNINKEDFEKYFAEHDNDLKKLEDVVGVKEEEKEPTFTDFKDKFLARIDAGEIKLDKNLSYDEFESLIFDNLELYKKDMTPHEKSKFMEDNKADLNRMYQYLLDKYKNNLDLNSDSTLQSIIKDFKSLGKENLEDVFGKEPTFEEFLNVVHSRVSLERLDLTTPEIEELLKKNESYLKESFRDIFKFK